MLSVNSSYFLGLLTATVSSEVFKAAQPALLYLVPFTLLPLLTMAYLKVRTKGDIRKGYWEIVCLEKAYERDSVHGESSKFIKDLIKRIHLEIFYLQMYS